MKSKKETDGITTIKDVARMANVSISTVSRVINKKGGVSEDLEKRSKPDQEMGKWDASENFTFVRVTEICKVLP